MRLVDPPSRTSPAPLVREGASAGVADVEPHQENDPQNRFAANRLLPIQGETLPLLRVMAPPATALVVWD